MNALPHELIGGIASWACTDGGKTGSTLSLVSRNIAAASLPYRYQSITLTDPSLAAALLSQLSTKSAEERRVADLFLGMNPPKPEDRVRGKDWSAHLRPYAALVCLLAGTLKTYTCIILMPFDDIVLQSLVQPEMPYLTSLAVHFAFSSKSHWHSAAVRMPRLRHLVCIATKTPLWQEFARTAIEASPTVETVDLLQVPLTTAVCLSFVIQGNRPTRSELQHMMLPLALNVYASHKFNVFRPERGLRVRTEAVGLSDLVKDVDASSAIPFCAQFGVRAYRPQSRTLEEWRKAWIANELIPYD